MIFPLFLSIDKNRRNFGYIRSATQTVFHNFYYSSYIEITTFGFLVYTYPTTQSNSHLNIFGYTLVRRAICRIFCLWLPWVIHIFFRLLSLTTSVYVLCKLVSLYFGFLVCIIMYVWFVSCYFPSIVILFRGLLHSLC